jgi:hypothetical protein
MENISSQAPTLIKGLGAIVGEIVLGVNGPFFFERFGLNVPEAILSGVLVGAAVGIFVASAGLAIRHRKPATAVTRGIAVDAHPHRA